ncbi:hypothetical protein [Tianweitania sediminis]|uniref:Bacteriophage protein n=1 Tax=Tianweitania sediminis TaxID=1502156 RepID=A0A8J7R2V5_9HYPH|nr:hypothetical protein [Tianweitania sediminis]MBP0439441.1 hypothetical protein [Tianweitania sediminis]
MAALSKGRNTPEREAGMTELPVKAATKIYAGGLTAVDANGLAVPMSTSTTLRGVGRAEADFDNSAGANGDIRARIGRGIYRYANSAATDAITAADIGDDCYGVDDQTVAKTNGTNTRSVAGKIHDVDAQGVWVNFG